MSRPVVSAPKHENDYLILLALLLAVGVALYLIG